MSIRIRVKQERGHLVVVYATERQKEGTNGQLNFGDSIVCKVQLKPSLKHKRAERTLPLWVWGEPRRLFLAADVVVDQQGCSKRLCKFDFGGPGGGNKLGGLSPNGRWSSL